MIVVLDHLKERGCGYRLKASRFKMLKLDVKLEQENSRDGATRMFLVSLQLWMEEKLVNFTNVERHEEETRSWQTAC